jgi:hypothetical protein
LEGDEELQNNKLIREACGWKTLLRSRLRLWVSNLAQETAICSVFQLFKNFSLQYWLSKHRIKQIRIWTNREVPSRNLEHIRTGISGSNPGQIAGYSDFTWYISILRFTSRIEPLCASWSSCNPYLIAVYNHLSMSCVTL